MILVRVMERIIMHIDVNNAFLSWTAIDLLNKGYKYDIRDSFAVVGGDESKRRGIVLAKSMKAKKVGIRTAETLYSARKKCPALRIYEPNYKWYVEMSNKMFNLINKYTPDIEIVSIDECFIDYGKITKLYGDPVAFAYKLKDEIKSKLGFTVNIGIANNKFCAKMASDFEKPNKVHTLFASEVTTKLWPLAVDNMYGVGKSSSSKLHALNINTAYDLAHSEVYALYKYFKNQSQRLIDLANGIDEDPVVVTKDDPKGISNTTTLEKDYTNLGEIYSVLQVIANNVATSLRKQKKYAYVVAIIIKDKFFKSYSHQRKLKNPTNLTSDIFEIAKDLFNEVWQKDPIRLIGIRLDNLTDKNNYQVSIFEDFEESKKEEDLDMTIDQINHKYGKTIINKASIKDINIKKKY